jgi:predicted oxidoreductase (fatty acid repression mutant protein)
MIKRKGGFQMIKTNTDFYTAISNRRTYYGISKELPVSDERIQQIIEQAVSVAPTAFNSQSERVILLLGEQHNKLWDITMETLRRIVPKENLAPTEQKVYSFRNGYGSILFFEEEKIIQDLQQNYPLYKDNFPTWAQQSNGILQYIIWTSLQVEGLGASLQHYNPLIDSEVKRQWNVPDSWTLIAQMPFGKPIAQPGDKEVQSLEDRVKIYK